MDLQGIHQARVWFSPIASKSQINFMIISQTTVNGDVESAGVDPTLAESNKMQHSKNKHSRLNGLDSYRVKFSQDLIG